jgi:hypothetical protein
VNCHFHNFIQNKFKHLSLTMHFKQLYHKNNFWFSNSTEEQGLIKKFEDKIIWGESTLTYNVATNADKITDIIHTIYQKWGWDCMNVRRTEYSSYTASIISTTLHMILFKLQDSYYCCGAMYWYYTLQGINYTWSFLIRSQYWTIVLLKSRGINKYDTKCIYWQIADVSYTWV